MLRKWDIHDEQVKKRCAEEVLARIDEQADAPFGVLAAEEIIEIVAERLGPQIYNAALADAKQAIQHKLADLEVDLDVLRVAE